MAWERLNYIDAVYIFRRSGLHSAGEGLVQKITKSGGNFCETRVGVTPCVPSSLHKYAFLHINADVGESRAEFFEYVLIYSG